MSIGRLSPEMIDAQYHCRELQVQNIIEETIDRAVSHSYLQEAFRWLNIALTTPPVFLPVLLGKMRVSSVEFLERINEPVIACIANGKIERVLGSLLRACAYNNRRITETPIDSVDSTVPSSYQILFRERHDLLDPIPGAASGFATGIILDQVQGESPLIRYRRDLFDGRIELKHAFGGAEIGSLPTKIPNVDVRYLYPRNQLSPILSFVVRPFDGE